MSISRIIAMLLVAATLVFAVGVMIERSQGESEASEASENTSEGAEGQEEGQGEEKEGEAAEEEGSESESFLGVNTESIPILVLAVAMSLALAAAVVYFPRQEVFALVLVVALAATAFDIREVIDQSKESRDTVMVLAIIAAILHAATAAAAAGALLRSRMAPADLKSETT